MEAQATARFVRIAPRKARRILELVRGRPVEEARRILRFSSLGGAPQVLKAVDSAVANAEQTPGVVAENLLVARATADEGPTLKRWRPRALGRATRVHRRTSHISIVVESVAAVEEVTGGPED